MTAGIMALAAPVAAAGDAADLSAYVRARAADADGRSDRAAAEYARALTAAPDQAVIAIRAYRAGLQAGDAALVARARKLLERAGAGPRDTALLALADALSANDRPGAEQALAQIADGPLSFLAPALRAWSIVEQNPAQALALASAAPRRSLGARYVSEARALLLIAAGEQGAGIAAVRALLAGRGDDRTLRLTAAQMLARAGAHEAAQALLSAGRIAQEAMPPGSVAQFGAARLLASLASDIAEDETATLAIALARAALILQPGDAPALLALAQALSHEADWPAALATLDAVPKDSPWFAVQQDLRIDLLARAGRPAEALALALPLAPPAGGDVVAHRRVGDLLMASDRFAEAASSYRRAIERAGAAPGADAGWRLYLQAGGALDRAGRWAEARPLIEQAVALAPGEAFALNYLGYSLLENGGDRARAATLLERALALRPDDGSILDSLGWCYLLGGDVARALPLLERAAAKSPDNATINDHLGDAYWRAGRHFEARYAWQAAQSLASGAESARITAKIAAGPGPL